MKMKAKVMGQVIVGNFVRKDKTHLWIEVSKANGTKEIKKVDLKTARIA